MPSVVKQYTDLNLDFIPHPLTGDIGILKNADAIKRSIRNLMYTGLYERPFQSKVGSGLRQLLFENINPLTQKSIEVAIRDVITAHEKRVSIIDIAVKVTPDHNGYTATLTFAIDNISQIVTIDLFLERIR